METFVSIVCIVWLTLQTLTELEVKKPLRTAIFVIVLVLSILWLLTGGFILSLR